MEFGGEEDYLANMTVPAKMENSDDSAQDAVSSVRGTKYDRIPFAAEHPPVLLTRWLTLSSRGNISLKTFGNGRFPSYGRLRAGRSATGSRSSAAVDSPPLKLVSHDTCLY
uniref:Uncharacterized protein n=1 Tax=Timema cristinae TaxID=61476 RepID=A0A7R9GXP4_TIMCR|nr:unnamed protein product [Timema cristinae]